MFFILSKTLEFLLSPVVWLTFFFLTGSIIKRPDLRRWLFITGFILLYIFTNSFLVNEVFLAWETKPVAVGDVKNYPVAIVLTGVTTERKDSRDKVHFERGADRLLHTIQLYKLGKIKTVVISGGSGSLNKAIRSEAAQIKEVFKICGIPDSSLIIEETSRNTYESAVNAKKIIEGRWTHNEILLVTSAFHMPRASGCFRKAGFVVKAYPTDFYTTERSFELKNFLVPSDTALGKWSIIIREIAGFGMYKIMGYLD